MRASGRGGGVTGEGRPRSRVLETRPDAALTGKTRRLLAVRDHRVAEFESGRHKPNPSGRLSEEFLIWAANKATGRSGDQAMFYEAVHGLETLGICQAALMPYSSAANARRQPSARPWKTPDRWQVTGKSTG